MEEHEITHVNDQGTDLRYGYYECSICGKQSQVLKVVQEEAEYGEFVEYTDVDGQASYELATEHEGTHPELRNK